ncbi:MAG: GldG family protein [bacterium]|jgi:gliding-associated putative ABC transporter substrate-binding component GldG|nr:GldG family protein [bacterium]
MRTFFTGRRRGNLWLVLAVLAALNVAGLIHFGRLDLTDGDIYTLSAYSRRLVAELEEPVTVKVFFSEDVGPQFNQNRTYLRDMLDDYKAFSHGRLSVEMVDPKDKEAFEEQARRYRIQPLQAQVLENDAFTSRMVHMGLAFLAGDRTETIPVLTDVGGLEYTITGTLRRLTTTQLPTLGILQGHGEPPLAAPGRPGLPPESGLGLLAEMLRKDYQVRPVHLPSVAGIPPEIGTLLWVKPSQPVDTATLYHLDQFLMRGGKLGLFLDQVEADLQTQQARPVDLGLASWLAHYGLRLQEALLADLSCGNVQVRQGGGGLMSLFAVTLRYPLFVQVKDFAADHAISRDLAAAALFFPSPLDTNAFAAARAMGAEVTVIARSTPQSEIQAPPYNLAPLERIDRAVVDERFHAGPQVLAATVAGPLASAFAGKPAIMAEGEGGAPGPPHLSTAADSRIALVGDGDFLVDGYAQAGNLALAQNITDWLSLDEGLISIRGKSLAARPLKELSAAAKKWIKWLNILGLPGLVIGFGLLRWSARRRRAQSL